MITNEQYRDLKRQVVTAGYQDDITWAASITPVRTADAFALEAIYVICNSGMRWSVAVGIFDRVKEALRTQVPVITVFGHGGKANAIEVIWADRHRLFSEYLEAPDKIRFLQGLPWIGGITRYHLAKNLGMDLCKPDRHLVRLAGEETAALMCQRLANSSGDSVSVVDTVLWRAAEQGLV